jgi:hypothetical protein
MIQPNDAVFLILPKQDLGNKEKMQDVFKSIELIIQAGGQPRHQLMFDGYNDDPRRIYQIPEAVAVCQRIMLETPAFIKFVGAETFTTLLMCTSIKRSGKWVVNPAWATVLPDYDQYELGRLFD